jgi:hypothetical protein
MTSTSAIIFQNNQNALSSGHKDGHTERCTPDPRLDAAPHSGRDARGSGMQQRDGAATTAIGAWGWGATTTTTMAHTGMAREDNMCTQREERKGKDRLVFLCLMTYTGTCLPWRRDNLGDETGPLIHIVHRAYTK